MRQPAYFRLSELPTAPLSQVGSWGGALGNLVRHRIPVSASCVISSATLWEIAEANQLHSKLSELSDQSEQRRIFTNQFIPPDIARSLLTAVHTELLDQKIRLTVSWLQPGSEHITITRVTQGDANCIESLLEVWTEAYFSQTGHSPKTLVPATIVLQIELESPINGQTFTHDESEAKHTIVMRLGRDRADQVSIDVRTWNILTRPKHSLYQRVKEQTWLDLARYLQTIRVWSLQNNTIDWLIYHDQVVITHLGHVKEDVAVPIPRFQSAPGRSIRGQMVVPGKVIGTVITDPRQARPRSVLVTSKLETIPIGFSTTVSAVVVENHITPSVSSVLKKYHVPVIVRAVGARQSFKFGDRVLVDATRGHISLAPQPQPLQQRQSTVPLFISASQSFNEEQVSAHSLSGVLFRPEMTLASTGNHPHHSLRGHGKSALFRQLTSAIASYRNIDLPLLYRLSTFTTDQLRSLHYGQMYEPVETNPRLGFYGAMRTITNPELLNFEVAALTRVLPMFDASIGLVLGGCRNPQELAVVSRMISKQLSQSKRQPIWWEISTPEHILNAEAYLKTGVHGVIINTQSLHALCIGIDPANHDVYHRYAWNESLIANLIHTLKLHLGDRPLMLYVMEDQPDLFRLVNSFTFAGIIVKSHLAQVAAKYLEEYANH